MPWVLCSFVEQYFVEGPGSQPAAKTAQAQSSSGAGDQGSPTQAFSLDSSSATKFAREGPELDLQSSRPHSNGIKRHIVQGTLSAPGRARSRFKDRTQHPSGIASGAALLASMPPQQQQERQEHPLKWTRQKVSPARGPPGWRASGCTLSNHAQGLRPPRGPWASMDCSMTGTGKIYVSVPLYQAYEVLE